MAEIVNLRQVRKSKTRAAKERQAQENRALHGRSKAERMFDKAIAGKDAARLDGHRRERPAGDE